MVTKDNCEKRHYFDWAASAPYNGTYPCTLFANPSSQHCEGKAAKLALEDARRRCAAILNVRPDTLFFTSGGTESNGIALFTNLMKKGKGRIIASLAEHSSVREGMKTLEKMGKPTGRIAVDFAGRVTPELLRKALDKYGDVRFVCCMAVNNETGAVTDIVSLREACKTREPAYVPLHIHCDIVQALGKIPVDILSWEIDSASISAHKIGGPRGIGLLYLRRSSSQDSEFMASEIFYCGGGQENGIRGGTENVQGATALAACLEKYAAVETVQTEYIRAKNRWKKLILGLSEMERCTIIPAQRKNEFNEDGFSPYILQAAFEGIPGEVMARALDDLGFAVSTGSACSSSSPERPVLQAMGVEEKLRIEGIRISQGFTTTEEEIVLLLDAIAEVLKFL